MNESRRSWLQQAAGALTLSLVPLRVGALEAEAAALLTEYFDRQPVVFDELVQITLPALAENGNSVAFGVQVESPMTEASYVAQIDVFAHRNPNPHLARFYLNPASGRAQINTRIRLAGSQPVMAVATLADRSLHGAAAEIVVTEAACLDFLI